MGKRIGGMSPEDFWNQFYPKLYIYAASFTWVYRAARNAFIDGCLRAALIATAELLLIVFPFKGVIEEQIDRGEQIPL